jgi:hypothetical protein
LTCWRGEARRGKKRKARSKNSRHPNDKTLRGGQPHLFHPFFKKANILFETQDDYRFKREEGRTKPVVMKTYEEERNIFGLILVE